MSSKRSIVLVAMLLASLALLAIYVYSPWLRTPVAFPAQQRIEPPLPGDNKISNLKLKQTPEGGWVASFDYFYTGEPKSMGVRLSQTDSSASQGEVNILNSGARVAAKRGANKVEMALVRPARDEVRFTTAVTAALVFGSDPETQWLAQRVREPIMWPTHAQSVVAAALAKNDPDSVVAEAVAWIDDGSRQGLLQAKALLEPLIEKRPQTDAAYVEMARVAMKSNWGPEGLHQAESLLGSALQLRPDSINAKILLGYVYAYQKRYKEAEAMLADASKVDTPNLWLWTNWGETYQLQGRNQAAIAKYKLAIGGPVVQNTYDHARRFAYGRLLGLLEEARDLDGLEALHKRRTAEYGVAHCYGVEYATFLLRYRGDTATAIELARLSDESGCKAAAVREVLALAHYTAWAAADGPSRADMLNQARVYLPAGARLFYRLASSDKLAEVAKQLLATGERIDQQDNARLTALAHALWAKELATARRLIRLGARPDTLIGEEQMPVALIPVMARDFDGIRLMQRSGVDFSKLRHQGATAIDHARMKGDRQLLQVLEPNSGAV